MDWRLMIDNSTKREVEILLKFQGKIFGFPYYINNCSLQCLRPVFSKQKHTLNQRWRYLDLLSLLGKISCQSQQWRQYCNVTGYIFLINFSLEKTQEQKEWHYSSIFNPFASELPYCISAERKHLFFHSQIFQLNLRG